MSQQCCNHGETPAVGHCAGCAEAFCGNCLLDLGGNLYCGSCKVLALNGRTPMLEKVMSPCAEAGSAMSSAVVGFFILGHILQPVAIIKALEARKQIAADPRLTGWGKANAALALAVVGLILLGLNLIARSSR